jgi:hypothetical protein
MNRLNNRQASIRAVNSEAVISMISVIYFNLGFELQIFSFILLHSEFLILLGILDTETFVWSRLRVSGTPP